MIKVPEILRKRPVREFIDCLIGELREFYSQPFSPEMITEYFDSEYPINPSAPIGNRIIISGEDGRIISFTFPKTLNRFISDCIQAGIKLTWKESQ